MGRRRPDVSFTCEECGLQYSRNEYLQRHLRVKHSTQHPYQCDDCGESFPRSDFLLRHRTTGCTSSDPPSRGGNQPRKRQRKSIPAGRNGNGTIQVEATEPMPLPRIPGDDRFPSVAVEPTTTAFAPFASEDTDVVASALLSLSPSATLLSSSFTQSASSTININQEGGMYPPGTEDVRSAGASSTSTSDFDVQSLLDLLGAEVDSSATSSPDTASSSTSLLELPNNTSILTSSSPFAGFNGEIGALEFTPEAQALAEYFNKGGVGGISALDLTFPTTPTLYPDHIFEPHIPEDDGKYYIHNDRIHFGYLVNTKWPIPPVKTLGDYAKTASEKFLDTIPIVHRPSISLSELPTHSILALSVTGASFEQAGTEGHVFSDELLAHKNAHLINAFNETPEFEDKFSIFQAILFYQILGLYHRDEQHRLVAHSFQTSFVSLLRKLSLPRHINSSPIFPLDRNISSVALEETWKRWIVLETKRRCVFITFLTDLEASTRFHTTAHIALAELDLDLPASDALWASSSAADWHINYLSSPIKSHSMPFLQTIRILLSPPDGTSDDSEQRAQISKLSQFPLLVLSRTLSYFNTQTEEAIRQADPFRSLAEGVGLFGNQMSENALALRKIARARSFIERALTRISCRDNDEWLEKVASHDNTNQLD
ncbi:hypothetical protein T439DRAFT_347140 [Meredithblackwellia eburnea MCA 4105]